MIEQESHVIGDVVYGYRVISPWCESMATAVNRYKAETC
jgi:hypothetical protein